MNTLKQRLSLRTGGADVPQLPEVIDKPIDPAGVPRRFVGSARLQLKQCFKQGNEPRRDCRRLPLLRLRSHHDETERQYLFT